MAIVTQASYFIVFPTYNDVVTYNPDGSLNTAKTQVPCKHDSPPHLIVPIKPLIDLKVARSPILEADSLLKTCLVYRKVIYPYMDDYGTIRREYKYDIDLEHAFKYLGFIFKDGGL